jgi:hypothetical protein
MKLLVYYTNLLYILHKDKSSTNIQLNLAYKKLTHRDYAQQLPMQPCIDISLTPISGGYIPTPVNVFTALPPIIVGPTTNQCVPTCFFPYDGLCFFSDDSLEGVAIARRVENNATDLIAVKGADSDK